MVTSYRQGYRVFIETYIGVKAGTSSFDTSPQRTCEVKALDLDVVSDIPIIKSYVQIITSGSKSACARIPLLTTLHDIS